MVAPNTIENPSSSVGASGPWTLIDRQEIIVATDTITFPGLDGDNDGIYFIVLEGIKGGAPLTMYSLQPNGSNANCMSCDLIIPPMVTAVYPADIILMSSGSPDGASFMVTALMPARTGRLRFVEINGNQFGAGASFRNVGSGTWNDSVTNLASIVLKANMANAFKAGTIATLYKISQTP